MNWDQSVDYFHPLKKLELWFHEKKNQFDGNLRKYDGEKKRNRKYLDGNICERIIILIIFVKILFRIAIGSRIHFNV